MAVGGFWVVVTEPLFYCICSIRHTYLLPHYLGGECVLWSKKYGTTQWKFIMALDNNKSNIYSCLLADQWLNKLSEQNMGWFECCACRTNHEIPMYGNRRFITNPQFCKLSAVFCVWFVCLFAYLYGKSKNNITVGSRLTNGSTYERFDLRTSLIGIYGLNLRT